MKTSVYGIVCAKRKHYEFMAVLKHVWKLLAIGSKHFCKMLFTARTGNGVAKHV